VFLLVPAYSGCPGTKAVKRLLLLLFVVVVVVKRSCCKCLDNNSDTTDNTYNLVVADDLLRGMSEGTLTATDVTEAASPQLNAVQSCQSLYLPTVTTQFTSADGTSPSLKRRTKWSTQFGAEHIESVGGQLGHLVRE